MHSDGHISRLLYASHLNRRPALRLIVTLQQNSARSFATASAISFPVLVSDVPAT